MEDIFVGRATKKGPESISKKEWGPGGCSRINLRYYAVVSSNAEYKAKDDSNAIINGKTIVTPEFQTIDELKEYMVSKNIQIGGYITTIVPINDWEHEVYERVIEMPITRIEIMVKYSIDMEVIAKLSEETELESVTNSNFNNTKEEEDLKSMLHKKLLYNLYLQILEKRHDDKGECDSPYVIHMIPIDINEIKTLYEILGIEKCSTSSEGKK